LQVFYLFIICFKNFYKKRKYFVMKNEKIFTLFIKVNDKFHDGAKKQRLHQKMH